MLILEGQRGNSSYRRDQDPAAKAGTYKWGKGRWPGHPGDLDAAWDGRRPTAPVLVRRYLPDPAGAPAEDNPRLRAKTSPWLLLQAGVCGLE